MIRTRVLTLVASTALMTGAAFAQTPAAPSSAPMTSSSPFMTAQGTGEFRASKFVGLSVYGTNNDRIGDINEILIDGTGAAKAVVIGVGGFLGIGEKNVAVPFSALEWVDTRPPASAATGPVSSAVTATTGAINAVTGTTSTGPARTPAETAAYNGYPDHATIKLSKADLQAAPAFKYYADTHSASGAPSNATAPMAPKP